MSSTLFFVGLPEDSKSSITNLTTLTVKESKSSRDLVKTIDLENTTISTSNSIRVPNAPKSCIGEIFNSDATDGGSPAKNSPARPRTIRDTPTRPRDTHSRLFGQIQKNQVTPMVTDTIRSHIQFGEESAGSTPAHSPTKANGNGIPNGKPNGVSNGKMSNGKMNGNMSNGKMNGYANGVTNGSMSSTPSRGEMDNGDHFSYASQPKRNPVTGDGVPVALPRRRHPAASIRGALLEHETRQLSPTPEHRYFTTTWPPGNYPQSTIKPKLTIKPTPYSLLNLDDNPKVVKPVIDHNSLSPQPVIDRHWPPFPAQHYLAPSDDLKPYHPLPPHAFIGMTSALGEKPKPDYKYNPIPSLDGPIDPYLASNVDPPPCLFKYERDAPIPDFNPIATSRIPGPHTLTGFPPIFPKHVPGYLFKNPRDPEDLRPKTYYVDYMRQRRLM